MPKQYIIHPTNKTNGKRHASDTTGPFAQIVRQLRIKDSERTEDGAAVVMPRSGLVQFSKAFC
jgi:hypothetical protein